jgi:hypothetical protein
VKRLRRRDEATLVCYRNEGTQVGQIEIHVFIELIKKIFALYITNESDMMTTHEATNP